jgi:cytochrome c biogenesis protein ResB
MSGFINIISNIKIFIVSSSFIIILLIYDTLLNKGKSVINSWIFLLPVIVLFFNILSCAIKRFIANKKVSLWFYFIHIGVLIIIVGFVLSSVFKVEGEMFLKKNDESNIIYSSDNEMYRIPFRIMLKDFQIEYYRKPYAVVVVGDKEYDVFEGKSFEYRGVVYKIEKFLNDFVMDENGNFTNRTEFFNNPAVMISYFKNNQKEKVWLFEGKSFHTPELADFKLKIKDSDIKDFISKLKIIYNSKEEDVQISVNSPYKFMDYKIYQTSYDPVEGKASIITVKKDNYGVITIFGFLILVIGVILWIF